MLTGAGRHAWTVAGLQMELGEGPCLQAYASGVPVLLPDLTAENANRWPAFASGRSIYDIAQHVVERRVRFNE